MKEKAQQKKGSDNEQDWENDYITMKHVGAWEMRAESWLKNMTSNSFSSLVFRL